MSKQTINWVEEVTTSTGKTYKKIAIDGVEGDVSVWPDYTQYNSVIAGAEVEGIVQTKGKYKNLVDGNFARTGRPAIAQAMEKKEASIRVSQERKDDSIKTSSTARDATLIITTFYPELASEYDKEGIIKEKWTQWRMWLLDNWGETLTF